jgi:hypothetical protein
MNVIAEKPWSWLLFEEEAKLLLSVVCGGVGVYDVDFELTGEEIASYRQGGSVYVDQLANSVRAKPAEFESRRLAGFLSRLEVGTAVDAWRKGHCAR